MRTLAYLLFLCLLSLSAHSQETEDSLDFEPQYRRGVSYSIRTRSGNNYTGYVKSETPEFVTIVNKGTEESFELRKSEIIRVTVNRGRIPREEIMGENPHAKGYLFLTSAFLFEPNKTSSYSHYLIFENINYAFSENWALSVNTLAFYPFSLGIRYAYHINDNNYLGFHVFGLSDVVSGFGSSFLFGYGAQGHFTKGNSNKNVTISGGLLGLNADIFYTSPGVSFVKLPFVSAAYCNRFSRKVAFNLEGWYLPDVNSGLGGAAFKFISNDFTCWTVGCYALMNNRNHKAGLDFYPLPIPYLGISKRFD